MRHRCLATLLFAAVFLGTPIIGLWARSYLAPEVPNLTLGSTHFLVEVALISCRGQTVATFVIVRDFNADGTPLTAGLFVGSMRAPPDATRGIPAFLFRTDMAPPGCRDTAGEACCPYWAILALVVAPYAACRLWVAWRGRVRSGCCQKCGYDLRASAGRCPECGSVPVAGPARGSTPTRLPPWAPRLVISAAVVGCASFTAFWHLPSEDPPTTSTATRSRLWQPSPSAAPLTRPTTSATTAPAPLVIRPGDRLDFDVGNLFGDDATTRMSFEVSQAGTIEVSAGADLPVTGFTTAAQVEDAVQRRYAKMELYLTKVTLVGVGPSAGTSDNSRSGRPGPLPK